MNIKKKILMIAVGPVLMLGVISIFFISTQVRKAVTSEIEEALKERRQRRLQPMTRMPEIIFRAQMVIYGRAAIIYPSRRAWSIR